MWRHFTKREQAAKTVKADLIAYLSEHESTDVTFITVKDLEEQWPQILGLLYVDEQDEIKEGER